MSIKAQQFEMEQKKTELKRMIAELPDEAMPELLRRITQTLADYAENQAQSR